MRRRKSVFPAFVIESLAVVALAGIYFSLNPFTTTQSQDEPLPTVQYLADDAHEIPRLTSPTQQVTWQEPVVYQPQHTAPQPVRSHIAARPVVPQLQPLVYSATGDPPPRNIIGVN